jgi:hypothetical protein
VVKMTEKIKVKSNGNGHNPTQDEEELRQLKEWKAKREKEAVPHAYNVLFNVDEERSLAQVTRLNPREIMFMGVNGVRDDALLPRSKRPSISACLRTRLMGLKISTDGHGRDDVLAVSQLSSDEANAQQGNGIGDIR